MTKENIVSLGATIRGEFLTAAILLERAIDFYLANYFTTSKVKGLELVLLIFGNERITLEYKLEILQDLCEEKKCDLAIQYPTILKDLKQIIDTRNVLAHYQIITNPQPATLPEGTIQFMKLKNVTSRVNLTELEHRACLDKINSLRIYIIHQTVNYEE